MDGEHEELQHLAATTPETEQGAEMRSLVAEWESIQARMGEIYQEGYKKLEELYKRMGEWQYKQPGNVRWETDDPEDPDKKRLVTHAYKQGSEPGGLLVTLQKGNDWYMRVEEYLPIPEDPGHVLRGRDLFLQAHQVQVEGVGDTKRRTEYNYFGSSMRIDAFDSHGTGADPFIEATDIFNKLEQSEVKGIATRDEDLNVRVTELPKE